MPNFPTLTAQVTTGNVRTTMDKYISDGSVLNYNARNPLGQIWYDPVTATKYRYVRYNSTANAAVLAAPGVVYWVDNLKTTVTSTMSESLSTKANSVAGYAMINSTDASWLTAALLNGNFIWIAVAGYVKAATAITSTAVDDVLVGSGTTAWTPARIATGSALTNAVLAVALTALSGAVADVDVKCESL